ncbi:cobalt/nickel transport protein [Prauserella shujinwangii]|uniref:Cobalt/nickel transport protein n=1 Tax=Prauserella shujinwangii TaxID=1453103 RepID=A0A2T0LSB2_9PSEU|nr:PDGLE domain-containing protein [Prauserella shujinwangii]PRX46512.1 cobalt/nickel transport protein [Prauserella shujinwangii]
MRTVRVRTGAFFAGLAVVSLVLAGVVAYFADGDPDGLEAVTRDGCTEVAGELSGSCAAQHARDHALAGSPLADYTVDGDDTLTGVAGVLGVLATLVVAGGLFWLLRRAPRGRDG